MSAARERLARTRAALLSQMQQDEKQGSEDDHHDPGQHSVDDNRGVISNAAAWLKRTQRAWHDWWQHHPAHLALQMAQPALQAYAHRRPARVVGWAAAAGALLVVARPWRLLSATTVMVAVLRSSAWPHLLASWITRPAARRRHRPTQKADPPS